MSLKNKNKSPASRKKKIHGKTHSHNKGLGKRNIFILSFILLITFLVFWNSIGNDFVTNWDDKGYLMDNGYIKVITPESIKAIFSSYYNGNYHPLTTITYALEYKFFGFDPKPYHINNLIIHLLNVIMVFVLMQLLIGRVEAAALAALFFGIHPMHVESISWISERKDLLYTFFYLGALINYIYYIKKENKKTIYFIVSLLLFSLSLISKSAAVSFPVLLLLIDYFYNRSFSVKTIAEKIPFFAFAVGFGVAALYSQSAMGAIQDISPGFSYFDRFFLANYTTISYIFKFFIPYKLCCLHPYPIKVNGMLPMEYYFTPIVVTLIVLGVYKSTKFKKDLIFGLLFFLIPISLVLQILPVGKAIVADRYTYVPYLGLLFILGRFYCNTIDNAEMSKKWKPVFIGVLAAFTLIFSIVTYNRNKVWQNGLTLFSDVIDKYPLIDYAYNNRGLAKGEGIRNSKTGEFEFKDHLGAIADYNEAVRLNPRFAEAINNRGFARYFLKDYKTAIMDFTEAVLVDPKYQLSYFNRGIVKAELKDYQGSAADYTEAIRIKPDYPDALYNRGNLKINNLQDYKGAVEDYTATIRYKPSSAEAYHNRGVAKYFLQDHLEAINDFNIAIQINPNYAEAYNNRGSAKFYLKKTAEACEDWHKADQLGYAGAKAILGQYCK